MVPLPLDSSFTEPLQSGPAKRYLMFFNLRDLLIMTKDEYGELLRAIAGGHNEIGAEAADIRFQCETQVTKEILTNYWGLIVSGDAIHQLYMDILRYCVDRLGSASPLVIWFFRWHVLSSSRYFCAFDLFKRGYFFESSSLARTLWETALTLCALKRQLVTIEDVLGGKVEAGEKVSEKQLTGRMKATDRKIQNALIWKNSDLTEETRKAVNVYLHLVNQATHKSNLGLAMNVKLAEKGEPIHLFPAFDAKRTEVSGNILIVATWFLLTTLSYMDDLMPERGSTLDVRYQKALLFFQELNKLPPNSVLFGIGDLIPKVFLVIPNSAQGEAAQAERI